MRKKNYLFVALFLLCSVTSYAQSQWGVFGQANLSGSTADGVGGGASVGVLYDDMGLSYKLELNIKFEF